MTKVLKRRPHSFIFFATPSVLYIFFYSFFIGYDISGYLILT
jgi:hypothetical protein